MHISKSVWDYYHQQDLDGYLSASFTQAQLDQRNDKGMTLLMVAALNGEVAWVKACKFKGADLDLVNDKGQKAVILAANAGHDKVIIHLIESGAGG